MNGVVTQQIGYSYATPDGSIITDGNGRFIPADPSNSDYQALLTNGVVIAPYAPDLASYAQRKRAALITAGCMVQNVGGINIPIWTDADAQAALTGAVVGSQIVGSSFSVNWKGRDGNFYPLNSTTIVTLALGAMNYVSSCFTAEDAVKTAIGQGSITTLAQIDAYAWPIGG